MEANIGGGKLSLDFNVVQPSHETAIIVGSNPISSGTRGVSMQLLITVHPTDVSFDEVELKEFAAPNTNVTGYYSKISLNTHPEKHWQDLSNANQYTDHAWEEGFSPIPYEPGSRTWDIPIKWRVRNIGDGSSFSDHKQVFTITDNLGTTKVEKLGKSAIRTP